MDKNRRKFIQLAGTVAVGAIVLPTSACNSNKASMDIKNAKLAKGSPFGIQLYTLRDDMAVDHKMVIQKLGSFGYQQIEGYEGKDGIFWGMGNKAYQSLLADNGMKMVSAHCDIYTDFETKAAQAAEIGMSYLVCPWVGPQKSMDDWKRVTEKFNECGAICKKNGIGFAYHNHAYTFKAFSGMIPMKYILDNTDPDLVKHEMDIYWVVTGGADPIEYLTKYSNRYRLCHVKDRMKDAGDERMASCDLGTGIIDFPSIIKVAKANGMEYFLFEQERYDNSTPMESAKVGADYMKKIFV